MKRTKRIAAIMCIAALVLAAIAPTTALAAGELTIELSPATLKAGAITNVQATVKASGTVDLDGASITLKVAGTADAKINGETEKVLAISKDEDNLTGNTATITVPINAAAGQTIVVTATGTLKDASTPVTATSVTLTIDAADVSSEDPSDDPAPEAPPVATVSITGPTEVQSGKTIKVKADVKVDGTAQSPETQAWKITSGNSYATITAGAGTAEVTIEGAQVTQNQSVTLEYTATATAPAPVAREGEAPAWTAQPTYYSITVVPAPETSPSETATTTTPTAPGDSSTTTPSEHPGTSETTQPSTSASPSVSVAPLPSEPAVQPSAAPSSAPSADVSEQPSAAVSDEPGTTPSDEPGTTPGDEPSLPEPSAAPVEPAPDAPFDFESEVNDTIGESVLTGIPIGSADEATDVSYLYEYSVLPAGTTMQVIDPETNEPVANDAPIATGQVVEILDADGNVIAATTVVIQGDVLGTGEMSLTQVVRLADAYLGTDPLEGVYLLAGKFTPGDTLMLTDLVKMAQLYQSISGGEE